MNLGYPKFKETPQVHRKSIRVKKFLKNQLCIDVIDHKLTTQNKTFGKFYDYLPKVYCLLKV